MREMKTIIQHHLTFVRIVVIKIKKPSITNVIEDVF
jgi:hypothetical protein